eukprot:TRINITY_DN9173_c0_g1::TRINITY_DN9173_c0_g1_i1::g.12463::m.12463 TRINITY_DN9173_c0_g1::TRINITY_DN9173_c0_g1_i1::g.12463  ORF type:complete len:245 (-),score=16.24,F-box/PF00646.28/8.5e-07,F-box/PF00646.28/4.3e+02,F-box/PF00646.28/4.4e+03,F-box-like/PF12937.2/5.1e-06,LRR_6/PF13516.1/1.4e+02,LRR_6/PF13516.1/1.5,LRR_6/PF13516.1/4.8e+02,LRR_6/PF13516.1/7.4e+02,PRANC/PF09372.5/0.14,LRR_8/PF13855.1/1.9e+02,LRR_8/PF13855.1/4.9,LRR_8/PF13855.1/14,F-box-like_2/PF13013.1/0.11 TRINITY_DN9173_c0_g1_i1:231-96
MKTKEAERVEQGTSKPVLNPQAPEWYPPTALAQDTSAISRNSQLVTTSTSTVDPNRPSWSQLPDDIVYMILEHVPLGKRTYYLLSRVCSTWRRVARDAGPRDFEFPFLRLNSDPKKLQKIHSFSGLRNLKLTGGWNMKCVQALVSYLGYARITHLDLCSTKVGPVAEVILQSVAANPRITELNLCYCKLDANCLDGLRKLVTSSNLQALLAAVNSLGSDGALAPSEGTATNPHLRKIHFAHNSI